MNTLRGRCRGLALVLCFWTLGIAMPRAPGWAQPVPGPARPRPGSTLGRDIGDTVVVRQPGGAVKPLPLPVAFFPENERSRLLSGTDVSYSYESCEAIDTEALRGKQRVTFAQLGPLADTLNRTLADGNTCAGGDCYLRVIAAPLGTTLTLRNDEPIDCEDPDTGGVGKCSLGADSLGAPNTFARPDRYRGNIVLADRIKVEGTRNLSGLNLVLHGRLGIELARGAVIRGGVADPKRAPGPVAATSEQDCHEECARWRPNHGPRDAEPLCLEERQECSKRFTAVPSGRPGVAGDPSGSLALITPALTVNPPSGTASQVVLEGQPGGPGGVVQPLRCEKDDALCRSSSESAGQSSRSGAGGPGGTGGKLVVVARRIVGGTLKSNVGGGRGGAPGALLRRFVEGDASANRSLGSAGATGAAGPNGVRQEARLGDAGYDYAYLLGARGAERLLLNGRHFARFVHPTLQPDNAAFARGALHTLLRSYCRPVGLDLTIAVPPSGVEPAPSGPTSYLLPDTTKNRLAVCREADARLAYLDAGLNWFGLPPGYFMYVRPDVVAGYRDRLLTETDRVGDAFLVLARGQQAAIDLAATERMVLAEKRKRVEIAELRHRTLVEAAMTKLGWVHLNEERLGGLDEALTAASNEVDAALQAPECDFLCVFGNFLTIVVTVASFVGGVISAVSSALDFIGNLGDIFKKGRILGELRSTGKISFYSTTTFDDLKIFGAYAKAVFKGAKIHGEEIGGIADIGGKVKETVEAWKETEAVLAGPDDVAGILHSIVYRSASAERELRNALGRVFVAIETVEGLDAGDVTDKSAALGKLHLMAAVLTDRIDLARQSTRLVDEHMMAAAEVPIAEQEVELARLERDQAEQRVHQLQCRANELPASACAGIPSAAAGQTQALRRDRACEAGRRVADATLLFDFYYQRSRDFVLLADRGTAPEPSHDFQRVLLDEADRLAFGGAIADAIHDDLIDVLEQEESGTALGDYCLPGVDCGAGATPDTRAYDRDVLAGLLRTGRTRFDPAADCLPGDPSSRCLPFLNKERPRERVVGARVELVMAPGYRLGCTSLTSCPAGQPADLPLDNNRFKIGLRHDELATFLWDDSQPKSLLFPLSYPRQACEIAKAYSGSPADCSAVIDFSGQSEYVSALDNHHDGPFDLEQAFTAGNPNAGLFGTSVRGAWNVDLSATLVQLNGESGDACYRFHPSNPAFQPLPATCVAVGVDPAPVQALCTRFVTPGGVFRPYGDVGCCTAAGRLRGNLSAAQKQSCNTAGFTGDAACVAPDDCLSICGPRCQAFKQSLLGLKWAIRWYAGR